jgi:predicted short-subunit dehydrogenase-like oxidoreductase (DUF2520 family)
MHIVLLGSGNVATHLGKALKLAGHTIVEVWSRTFENAQVLASVLQSKAVAGISEISQDADIYIISVKDDVIPDVANSIPVKDKLVIHTSGSVDINVLKDCSSRFGVFYPLQTFSKAQEIEFREIPIVLEGSSAEVAGALKQIALQLSSKVYFVNSQKRQVLHVAAVFANNFTNYLYALADNLLRKHELDFDLIRPLIKETAKKVQNNAPDSVQTGPARRNDKKIMDEHLELLKDNPDLYSIYQLLSQSIVNLK